MTRKNVLESGSGAKISGAFAAFDAFGSDPTREIRHLPQKHHAFS
jgi:hypothetical protein